MVLLESKKVPLGSPAHDFSLKGVDDRIYSLNDFSANVLVIVFMCNHCPYVQAIWQRLNDLQARFKDMSVQLLGINPNLHPDYPEETMEKMKEYYEKFQMNFPYLQDDTQKVAKSYGAVCTPDIFVYDKDRKLVYHGRIDDSWKEQNEVTKHELAEAIETLLHGEKPDEKQNPSMGCSIKWVV